ncbi:DUF6519 domain-containing protein [Pelagibius sp. Alg239-R121]|uniref:DUF6519 domain-containing protein n=1 Tax=Pelagibius sp. Alg239-R121 TaxID=2993448 RepID=UPI0024A6A394|nr:DUF6519 domain-containing protein [Pelagibius sp. Alg239-R121]
MSGDYSRDSFDALRDYAGVFLQQGRAVLDSDWNEMVEIFERRIRTGTIDTIGRAVVPRETILGFQIRIAAGGGLEIGRGRKYLDGMLLECHGAANYPGSGDDDFADPVFDRAREGTDGPEGVLDELISQETGDFLPYDRQPYWPDVESLPTGAGPHLVYVVAWHREVTPLEQPELLEPALGGIDTTTRWQTVWQVRVLPNVGPNATCATEDDQLEGWINTIAPSTARLTTDTVDVEDPENPCLVPPTDGYIGIENQFYCAKLHSVGDTQEDARFKFSRENGSVAAAIETFANPADRITVRRIGRDEILRFRAGDWVEITDDRRELDHHSGQMLRVALVNEETREIELEGTINANLVPSGAPGDTVETRRSRIIRWDQRGVVRLADGTEWVDLDAPGSDGLIPVPSDGTAIMLESGVTVSFSTAAGPGGFREMDCWSFAARTAGTQIEELRNAPPQSVQRHYCRLAVVTFPNSVQDCRVFWPPEIGEVGESCGCTVCVTPEGHNSGQLTIQAAIDQIGPEGGTVCLDGGAYTINEQINITSRTAITLRGQGLATLILYQGNDSAIAVTGSVDVQIERLSVLVAPDGEDAAGNLLFANGITATNTAFLALRRLAVLVGALGEARQDHGIAIEGVAIGSKIEECLVLAPIALGSFSALDPDNEGPGYLAVAEFRALDNILFGMRAAMRFSGTAFNVAGVTATRNLFFGADRGVQINWYEPPIGATALDDNTIFSNGDAAVLGLSDLRLQDNEISGGPQNGSGVRLIPNVAPDAETDAQIIGNRIGDLAATGISIEGRHGALLIKRNVIRRCGTAGILTAPDAIIRHIAVDNNVIEEIGESINQDGTGAVILTRVATGQIIGNSIRAIGQNAPEGTSMAGVAVQGVGSVAIDSNVFSLIGPDRADVRAAAIMARPPVAQLSIQSNRINGVAARSDNSTGWMAIEVGPLGIADEIDPNIGSTPSPQGFLAAVPRVASDDLGFAAVGGEVFAFSRADFLAIARARRSQIMVQNNQVHHAARLLRAMISIVDSAASAVSFNQNQCEQDAGGGVRAVVLIGAPRITASSNVVRHQSDSISMLLSIGRSGAAAPVGNITTGSIEVIPTGLNPAFATLNLKNN